MEALKLESVMKQYGEKTAVNGINLTVGKGNLRITGGKWCRENNHNAHGAWPNLP